MFVLNKSNFVSARMVVLPFLRTFFLNARWEQLDSSSTFYPTSEAVVQAKRNLVTKMRPAREKLLTLTPSKKKKTKKKKAWQVLRLKKIKTKVTESDQSLLN